MHYSLFSGGKRFRPILCLATGELFGATQKVLMPFACGLEMIHTYSIVHDDLPAMDDDDLRRGQPTTHKQFGEGVALLAGDALLTEAFRVMSDPQVAKIVGPKLMVKIVHEVSHAVGIAGLVGGQAFDIEAEDTEVDVATVEYIHIRKTGALILAAARVGALVGKAKGADLRKISRYAEFLGLAFQIADDILDASGQPDHRDVGETGFKEPKKATYPSVVGLGAARARLRELVQRCIKELSLFDSRAEPLRQLTYYIAERAIPEKAHQRNQETNV